MLFSCGVTKEATRDFRRIQRTSPPEEEVYLEDCFRTLCSMLRYDPHLQGRSVANQPFRFLTCGLVQVMFVVRPLDDRYVSVEGVGRNPGWQW